MIRKAKTSEHKILTRISFKSKGYWKYPEPYFRIWKNELTISPEYIHKHAVYLLEQKGIPIAYYSLVHLKRDGKILNIPIPKGYWLDHMFILPEYIGKGFGKKLFGHLKEQLLKFEIMALNILSDPNARAFYEKMGCNYIKEYPSTIKGRTTPLLIFHTKM